MLVILILSGVRRAANCGLGSPIVIRDNFIAWCLLLLLLNCSVLLAANLLLIHDDASLHRVDGACKHAGYFLLKWIRSYRSLRCLVALITSLFLCVATRLIH